MALLHLIRVTWRCCFLIHNSCSTPRTRLMQIFFVGGHQIFSTGWGVERRKKEYQNVERRCFFSFLIPFCFSETTLCPTIPCLPHIKATISHFLPSSLCFIPSNKYSPHTLPLPPVRSLWSVLQCLTHPLRWPQIQIQIQLHWHDKRSSSLGLFSMPGLPQSDLPWPSNLCFSLECGLYDLEEG